MIVVYSYYVLDVVHKGHLEMLQNAKAVAGPNGRLIVGILTDKAVMEKKPRPITSFEERVELARNIRCVDLVVAQETYSPYNNIESIRPDILMESTSHEIPSKKEATLLSELISRLEIKVITIPYFPEHSSTQIKDQIRKSRNG